MTDHIAQGPTWAEVFGKLSGGETHAELAPKQAGGGVQVTYDGPGLLDIILKPFEAELEAG